MKKEFSAKEMEFLKEAYDFLENESMLIKIANLLGKPIELLHRSLPAGVEKRITKAVQISLNKSLEVALEYSGKNSESSMCFEQALDATLNKRMLHGGLTAITGALGGFFGEVGLVVELPITTTLIMRNIIEVGSQFPGMREKEDFSLNCLTVFTLGSQNNINDESIDSSYYTSRYGLTQLMRDGAQFIAANSARVVIENAQKGTASPILNFIARVAAEFEIVVTEKMLAEMIPVVGSLGGATINVAFTDYFGEASKYHFGMLYLENKYGKDVVQGLYEELSETKLKNRNAS